MPAPAPPLLELQRAMRTALLRDMDGTVCAHVIADGMEPEARLGIYRNTAAGVLATALQLSFPAVRRLVGPEFFDGAARLFAAESPPHGAWLDEYGAGFAEFLAGLPQAASLPYLEDVANLEWHVNLALHAPDTPPLDAARLALQPPEALAQWRFARHPAARLLWCAFPADAIWRAVLERDERAMAAIDLDDGPVWLLVHREENGIAGGGIDIVRLDACEWRLTAALFSGTPLHEALEEAPCANAHAMLASHLASGCFVDARCSSTPT